jgi:hypothetical protein
VRFRRVGERQDPVDGEAESPFGDVVASMSRRQRS